MKDVYQWRRMGHIPLLIILQFIFIILFAKFVVYDEHSAIKNVHFDRSFILTHKQNANIATEGQNEDPQPTESTTEGKNSSPAFIVADKLINVKEAHQTTRDAKEILTDYQSKHMFIRWSSFIIV